MLNKSLCSKSNLILFFLIASSTGVLLNSCTENHKQEIKGTLLSQAGKRYAIFMNLQDTSFYLLQFRDTIPIELPKASNFESFVSDTLTIRDLEKSQSLRYFLDSNVYGIGKYTGNEYYQLLTDQDRKGFRFRNNIEDLISLMSCLCYPFGGDHNCKNGKNASGSCNARLAHMVGKEVWSHQCQISCNQGYSPCCN